MMETVTITLTEFLLARIAEDADAARVVLAHEDDLAIASPLPMKFVYRWSMHYGRGGSTRSHEGAPSPRRVLAECEAKRRIVEAFEDERQRMDIYNRDYPLGLLTTEDDLRARLSSNARWAGLEVAARALALPYADHPEFRAEWRA